MEHTVELVNDACETRQRSYAETSSLEDLCKEAALDAVAETGDTSWKVTSIISEPVPEWVLEDRAELIELPS